MSTSIDPLRSQLARGGVIPACPLALDAQRRFDPRHQRAILRYYGASGAAGVAVGVHTTQFAIHTPQVGLYEPLLALAAETIAASDNPAMLKIAGLVGDTAQATGEARLAADLGYHCGLLSLSAFRDASLDQMLAHCRAVGQIIPLVGFYLQPAVGGRLLPYRFWREFAQIESVVAIKIAPFNRYQTLDVVRAVADSGRADQIALYTGNDDNIVVDLLTPFSFAPDQPPLRIVGGLLGHWAVWTRRAIELWADCQAALAENALDPAWLTRAAQVTDSNSALFDVANAYAGCIAGLHHILAQQGLMAGRWCLDPDEDLSPGQADEIARVRRSYPHLHDDPFVAAHLDQWLS